MSTATVARDLAEVSHDEKPKSRGGRPVEAVRQAEIDKAVARGLAEGEVSRSGKPKSRGGPAQTLRAYFSAARSASVLA